MTSFVLPRALLQTSPLVVGHQVATLFQFHDLLVLYLLGKSDPTIIPRFALGRLGVRAHVEVLDYFDYRNFIVVPLLEEFLRYLFDFLLEVGYEVLLTFLGAHLSELSLHANLLDPARLVGALSSLLLLPNQGFEENDYSTDLAFHLVELHLGVIAWIKVGGQALQQLLVPFKHQVYLLVPDVGIVIQDVQFHLVGVHECLVVHIKHSD